MTATARPRRSDATRLAILQAARERFAAEGYERATIRAIAADARIDPSMVMRYFVSKEQLFVAATDFNLQIPDLAQVAPEERGRVLVQHFLRRWEGDLSDHVLPVLLRCALTTPAAAERVQAVFAQQVMPFVAGGLPPEEAGERASLVASQMLGLAICRYVMPLPPLQALEAQRLIAWVAPTIQRYLEGQP